MKFEHLLWHHLIRPVQRLHRKLYAIGKTDIVGRIVLLLTTTGRKSGVKRVTPLQFSELDGDFYVASSRGTHADWYCNLLVDPHVEVDVDQRHLRALAEPVTDPIVIADYLQSWLGRRPRMAGAMMHLHGLPSKPSRAQLEKLSGTLALVILHPEKFDKN